MNEKKCDEEIFQDHRDQELAAAATRTTQIQNTGLLYAPHGLRLSPAQKSKILSIVPKGLCLLFTVTLYELPLILGGTVNLGVKNASELIHDLNVTDFIPTHSSNERRQNGLVTKFCKSESGGCWNWGCFGISGERDYESCKETNLIATVAHVRV